MHSYGCVRGLRLLCKKISLCVCSTKLTEEEEKKSNPAVLLLLLRLCLGKLEVYDAMYVRTSTFYKVIIITIVAGGTQMT